VSGLTLVGTRETQTIGAVTKDSDRPQVIVKQFWYSRDLGLNVVTRRADPRSGIELFTVTDINRTEPDPTLFALAPDAQIVDYRAAPPAPRSASCMDRGPACRPLSPGTIS
jgi:hypothetical protein